MKKIRRPMGATVLFGLVSGFLFVPTSMVLSYFLSWPMAIRLTGWAIITVYGLLMSRWAKVKPVSILFPCALLLIPVFEEGSNTTFLLLALGILSWIRSGICFQGHILKVLGTELVISLGGGALVAYFAPYSTITWAMGIWMFFLVQSLYFIFGGKGIEEKEDTALDPFEQSRRRAEKIFN